MRNNARTRYLLFDGNSSGGAGVGAGAAARAVVADASLIVFDFDARAGAGINARAASDAGVLINCSGHFRSPNAFKRRSAPGQTSFLYAFSTWNGSSPTADVARKFDSHHTPLFAKMQAIFPVKTRFSIKKPNISQY